VNTPGFKRQYVTFEEELKQVLRGRGELRARTTHPRHIQFGGPVDPLEVKPRVWTEENTVFRNDLNNVNIDVEMTNLQKNTLMYEALATIISRKFKALKDVIMRTRP
jgi:flagellar basal-body rod protein FlgB